MAFVSSVLPFRKRCPLPTSANFSRTKPRILVTAEDPQQAVSKPTLIRVHDKTEPSFIFSNFPESPIPRTVSTSKPIPAYLHNTTYYRVGPGRFTDRHKDGSLWKADHLFDGQSMLSSFHFDANASTVTVRSRFNSTRLQNAIRETSGSSYRNFHIAPSRRPIWQQILTWRPPTFDPEIGVPYLNYVVTIENIPGKGLCARTDSSTSQVVNPETLCPVGQLPFKEMHPKLSGLASMAHGMADEASGEYFNIVWDYFPGKVEYRLFRISSSGQTSILATFREPAYYMHSASMTENYIVVMLAPVQIKFLTLAVSMCLGDAINVPDGEEVKYVVVSRKTGGVVKTYSSEFLFAMHSVNAFEKDGDLILDLCCTLNVDEISTADMSPVRDKKLEIDASLFRCTLHDIASDIGKAQVLSRAVSSRMLFENSGDFPIVSPRFLRKEYRFMYSTGPHEGVLCGSLRKTDVTTGKIAVFSLPNCILGEPLFMPDPDGIAEDDGCIIVVALDTVARKSVVLILDAKHFVELSRAELPVAIPTGFHGYLRKSSS